MKARYFLPLAAIVLLAGCNKEVAIEEIPQPEVAKTVLEVSIGQDTKTVLGAKENGEYKVYWSDGDQIAVNGEPSEALSGLSGNEQSATFTFSNALSTPYNIVYPASIYKDASHVTLPAVQTYKAGGFADGMFPMAGYSADGSNITLSHLCAIVKIQIKRAVGGDEENIASVRFKGRNGEQVSGEFEINYSTPALAPAVGTGANLEVRVVKNLATSTTDAVVYYLVIPAREYANGFDIIVQDASGHIMTKSKTSSWTPAAGKLYVMPEFDFVPTGTELGVEIASAEDLVRFATDYNNKVYDGLGSTLIATVTKDITFDATSSAAFNATGGIGLKNGVGSGTEDYYFDGVFNGGNHTISGLEATVPLFVATNRTGTIQDLNIDDSCSFTFTHPNSGNYEVGSVVGYHRGTLDNVSVSAAVTLADAEVTQLTSLGGLAGRIVVGTIDNCTYSGALTVPAGFSATDKKIYIGGLAGWISNEEGKVLNSAFEGTLENEGQMVASSESDEMKNYPQLIMGGVVGLNAGTVSDCSTANHATGITVTLNDGSDHNYTGTIVTHSTIAYHYAIAGIVGRNDNIVSDCSNTAGIVNIFSAERGSGGNMNGRYLEVGGLVGYNASGASISGGTNSGSIIDRANPKIHYVGGLVGRNYGSVSSSSNSASGTIGVGTSHLTPYGARMPYIGGAIGSNESGATLSDIQNAANINVSRIETTTGFICRIGGIAGYSKVDIDGAAGGGSISNSGNISQSTGIGHCSTPDGSNDYGYHIGGIVGNSTRAVKNASNSGNITFTCNATTAGAQYVRLGGIIGKVDATATVDVEKCVNTGNVTFNPTSSAPQAGSTGAQYYFNYLGGIVGYANNAAIKGDSTTKCTNSGNITGGDGSGNLNKANTFWVGGIVGYITGDSSIEYCDLIGSGQAYNNHFSNRGDTTYDSPTVGGIAGHVAGEDGTPIAVSNCSVAGTATVTGRRGAVGGIVGMAQYSTISSCTFPLNLAGSGYIYGGIVAQAQNSSINNCVYSGTTINSSQIKQGGGIIGKLESDTSINGCSSYATSITKSGNAITSGGIAATSVAGTIINNCHYASTIAICSDSNFTGNGNVADL